MTGFAGRERRFLCGIDEAGRGPIAGPVFAAAVILPEDFNFSILNDSKKMSEKRRFFAMKEIYISAETWGTGSASSFEIDSMNILQASLTAMGRAYGNAVNRLALRLDIPVPELENRIDVVVDGTFTPLLGCASCKAVVKADSKIYAVMAASILAKTARDKMMVRYSWLYPGYGYEKHKGYPTSAHCEALKKLGPSPIQRHSFKLKG